MSTPFKSTPSACFDAHRDGYGKTTRFHLGDKDQDQSIVEVALAQEPPAGSSALYRFIRAHNDGQILVLSPRLGVAQDLCDQLANAFITDNRTVTLIGEATVGKESAWFLDQFARGFTDVMIITHAMLDGLDLIRLRPRLYILSQGKLPFEVFRSMRASRWHDVPAKIIPSWEEALAGIDTKGEMERFPWGRVEERFKLPMHDGTTAWEIEVYKYREWDKGDRTMVTGPSLWHDPATSTSYYSLDHLVLGAVAHHNLGLNQQALVTGVAKALGVYMGTDKGD